MKLKQIITSLLEQDMYKYSMGQAVLHWFPRTNVKVEFKCRNNDVNLVPLKYRIDKELDWLCSLRYTKGEIDYIRSIPWFTNDFADYMERFYLKRDQIQTGIDEHGNLTIVAEGPWRDVMHFEIPVLAIVSQIYMEEMSLNTSSSLLWKQGDENLMEAIAKFKVVLVWNTGQEIRPTVRRHLSISIKNYRTYLLVYIQ